MPYSANLGLRQIVFKRVYWPNISQNISLVTIISMAILVLLLQLRFLFFSLASLLQYSRLRKQKISNRLSLRFSDFYKLLILILLILSTYNIYIIVALILQSQKRRFLVQQNSLYKWVLDLRFRRSFYSYFQQTAQAIYYNNLQYFEI